MKARYRRFIYICVFLVFGLSSVAGAEIAVSLRANYSKASLDPYGKPRIESQNAAKEFLNDLEGDIMGYFFDEGHIATNLPFTIDSDRSPPLGAAELLSLAKGTKVDWLFVYEFEIGPGRTGKQFSLSNLRVSLVRTDTMPVSLKSVDLPASLAAVGEIAVQLTDSAEVLLSSN